MPYRIAGVDVHKKIANRMTPCGRNRGSIIKGMSIKVAYRDGVFEPLDNVEDAQPGALYTVFSEEELRDFLETVGWLRAAEKSFEFWDNQDDAVYDTL